MWDLADYIPALLDAQLTGRGGWKWGSATAGADIVGGIYAPYKGGDRLLVVDASGNLGNVDLATQAITAIGAVGHIAQNPVMHRDAVIVPNSDGNAAKRVTLSAGSYAMADLPASAPKARYAAVYKDRVLLANQPGEEQRLSFSPPGDPMAAWDALSYFNTSLPLTGIGALRAVTLLFHSGSVERIRGAIPPSASDPLGDMFMEPLYDRAGCGDQHSIAYWNDNCIFADERGVHFTDGAIVRNLAAQGGILTFWRTLYRNKQTIAADTYLDYYIVTVIRTDGVAVTLLCDLNRRAWFRFTNIRAVAYIHSIGAQEQLWGCRQGSQRLAALSNCFFPVFVGVQQDDDGSPVLPMLETPWYKIAEEGRKRVRFVYVSYDVRTADPTGTALPMAWRAETKPEGSQQQQLETFEAEAANGVALTALTKLLEVGYITQPHTTTYTIAGSLPETSRYSRYRLPVGKDPYGIAFRLRQTAGSHVTRVYDLAAEAQADERSRV
jgi:hypothetical protein